MSLYALTWGVAMGIAPVFGGFLNDTFGPHFIWLGGAIAGSLAVTSFLLLARFSPAETPQSPLTSQSSAD
jgi:MFS family permease